MPARHPNRYYFGAYLMVSVNTSDSLPAAPLYCTYTVFVPALGRDPPVRLFEQPWVFFEVTRGKRVTIVVAAPRRGPAFEASRYAIERIKEIVPIWKREIWPDGCVWVGSQVGTRDQAPQVP